jgi:hypothetical protein
MKSGVRERGGQGEVTVCVMVVTGLDMDTIRDMDMEDMGVRLSRDGGRSAI